MKSVAGISLLLLFVFSCGRNPAKKNEYDRILLGEIQRRIELISEARKDTIYEDVPDPMKLHKEVNELILLTKDVENSDVVLKRANDYFRKASEKYHISNEGFVTLLKTMSLSTIESTIITNELNLLDKIIFTRINLQLDTSGMTSVY